MCGDGTLVDVRIERTSAVKHDGKLHQVTVKDLPARQCDKCSEIITSSRAHRRIYAELRTMLGLLSPEEIRSRREDARCSQSLLAERLGVAQETISRWENGRVIQSSSHNRLLKHVFGLEAIEVLRGLEEIEPVPCTASATKPATKTVYVQSTAQRIVDDVRNSRDQISDLGDTDLGKTDLALAA